MHDVPTPLATVIVDISLVDACDVFAAKRGRAQVTVGKGLSD